MRITNYFAAVLCIILFINTEIKSQQKIENGVIANGGTSALNENNRIVGTIGQSIIGKFSDQTQIIRAGFWEQNSSLITDIKTIENKILNEYCLYQNYPNPFNPSTKISWQSPVSGWQTLKVYDLLGKEVKILIDEFKLAGIYEVEFDASNLASGVYFYKIISGSFVETKKMILVR